MSNSPTKLEIAENDLKALENEYKNRKGEIKQRIKLYAKEGFESRFSSYGLGKEQLNAKNFDELLLTFRRISLLYYAGEKNKNDEDFVEPIFLPEENELLELVPYLRESKKALSEINGRLSKLLTRFENEFDLPELDFLEVKHTGELSFSFTYFKKPTEELLKRHSELIKRMSTVMKVRYLTFRFFEELRGRTNGKLQINSELGEAIVTHPFNGGYNLNGNFLYEIYQDYQTSQRGE